MIAHLTGSSRNSGKDLTYLRQIISTLHANEVEIALNWIETANNTVKLQPEKVWDWQEVVADNLAAIDRADIVIVEVTSYAFFQGYQIAYALGRNKPVLAVSRNTMDDLAIAGIKNDLLTIAEYSNEAGLESIVSNFITRYAIDPSGKAITVSLDVELNNYIRKQMNKTGQDKSQVLLDLAKRSLKTQN